jgi:Na+/melibiose symporter-like transporter
VQSLGANQTEHTLLLLRVFEVGLPALFYGLAIVAMLTYDLSPANVEKIQRELEKRRGKAS